MDNILNYDKLVDYELTEIIEYITYYYKHEEGDLELKKLREQLNLDNIDGLIDMVNCVYKNISYNSNNLLNSLSSFNSDKIESILVDIDDLFKKINTIYIKYSKNIIDKYEKIIFDIDKIINNFNVYKLNLYRENSKLKRLIILNIKSYKDLVKYKIICRDINDFLKNESQAKDEYNYYLNDIKSNYNDVETIAIKNISILKQLYSSNVGFFNSMEMTIIDELPKIKKIFSDSLKTENKKYLDIKKSEFIKEFIKIKNKKKKNNLSKNYLIKDIECDQTPKLERLNEFNGIYNPLEINLIKLKDTKNNNKNTLENIKKELNNQLQRSKL